VPTYDPTTALLVVDAQNDFADPSGSLYVRGGEEIVPIVNGEIARAEAAGAFVIATQDWHPEHTPHFVPDGGIWPVHCVRDTWGAAFRDDLELGEAAVIRKGADGRDGYSGFSVRDPRSGAVDDTVLQATLAQNGIRRLVVCGIATDYCVVETVLDARMRGYPAEVLTSAIRAVDLEAGDGDRALTRMRDAGAELV
jgi:nicotinamidase/pyrazinamidase